MTRLKLIFLSFLIVFPALQVWADDSYPSAAPKMEITTSDGTTEETAYTGSAPIQAHFTSNVENIGAYTVLYEWNVYEAGKEDQPYITRYDADMDYTFTKSGTSYISLAITFVNGTDTLEYSMDEPFSVTASESVLLVPNAFSPNGDGTNDVFKVKDGYKSIIKFHGYIFNRWGKKLFEWTDPAVGWDGTSNGHNVADGVYFCKIEAEGADGRKFHIQKAVNLLRGYDANASSTGGN